MAQTLAPATNESPVSQQSRPMRVLHSDKELYLLTFVSAQIDCHADHEIRRKTSADGSIACPGEIAVYLSDKVKACTKRGQIIKYLRQ